MACWLLHECPKFGASGTMIHQELSANGLNIPCIPATNLKDAVEQARKMAKHGWFSSKIFGLICLFSHVVIFCF